MEEKISAGETVLVDVTKLKGYDKNPRKGNVKAIAESLQANSQYRPIVVQKKTNKILAGNHTWKAAKQLGWKKIAVVFVDVDDEQAKRIVLADNRTNDLAEYDNDILAELLKDLGTGIGTGYSEQDMEAILGAVTADAEEVLSFSDDIANENFNTPNPVIGLGISANNEEWDDDDEDFGLTEDDKSGDEFKDAQAQLQGILQLADEAYFEMGKNRFDIPPIRTDRLVQSIPTPISTWGGKEASEDDGETWWIWNYGLASPTGMPYDRSILCFYTYDYKFEQWWDKPSYYTAKVLNLGVKNAIAPDFSVWYDDPKVFQIYSIYRAQWFARYFQEAGMNVIPRVIMSDSQEMLDVSFMGVPRNAPVL